MTVLHTDGKRPKRRPSLRGAVSVAVRQGQEVASAWPRSRGKTLPNTTKEQMEWFRQAQWATKYMSPDQLFAVTEASAGTPLLPRDLLTMMMSGRLLYFITPDGKKVFPRVAMNDVSKSLDTINQTEGWILIRGPTEWVGAPPPSAQAQAASVRYNGVTDTVLGGYNVSSVTKNGTGDYTVNFATPMQNDEYSVCLTGTFGGEPRLIGINIDNPTHTVNALRIYCVNFGNSLRDCVDVNVQIFEQIP